MHHRLQFRQNRKTRVLIWSQRLAIAGLTLLAVAMTGAVFLVGDFVFDSTAAAIGAAIPALVIADHLVRGAADAGRRRLSRGGCASMVPGDRG